MFQRRLIPLILVATIASCSRTVEPKLQASTPHAAVLPAPSPMKETPTADRRLSDYSFGGRIVCHEAMSLGAPQCQSSYRKARDFIWNHWREKKHAYIVVMITSPDAGSNVHIFIEPDDANVWRVIWRSESLYCASCPRPTTASAIHQSREMRSIERKRATATDVDMPFGTRYLVFLDASGDEVERL